MGWGARWANSGARWTAKLNTPGDRLARDAVEAAANVQGRVDCHAVDCVARQLQTPLGPG